MSGRRLSFLSLLILFALSGTNWAISAEEQPKIVEYTIKWEAGKELFCTDQESISDIMRKVKEYPILVEENATCREAVTKLESQVSEQAEVSRTYEEWKKLEEAKVAFYKEMAEEYKKLAALQGDVIERQDKQLKRNETFNLFKMIGAFIAGIAIALSF